MREHKLREIMGELGVPIINKTVKGWLVASCPFAPYTHERGRDKSPSFNVYVDDKGISGYNCFTCHDKGNIYKLVKRLEYYRKESYGNLSLRAVMAETPESFDAWDSPTDITPEPEPLIKAAYIGMWPLAWENEAARTYLMSRGVTQRTAMTLEMQYDPEECRIIVPVYNRHGQLFGFNGRSILPDDQFPYERYKKTRDYAGLEKARNLLGFQHAKRGKPIMLVEGLFALAHAYDVGIDQLVTPVATMGAYLSEHQRDMLAELGESVYICYDNDAAGDDGLFGVWDSIQERHLGDGAIARLSPHIPTLIPYYPPGINDPDHLGFDNWAQMIAGAQIVL
jgi:hypothetical protein